MTALQVIIKEAKAIRSKNPKMEWKKAVAQASAIYASKHKGKSPVGKKKVIKKSANKKLGALPIGFKGTIWTVKFKIVNQYDIYNDVSAIMEDTNNGSVIVVFDGKGSASDKADKIVSYAAMYRKVDEADKKMLKSRMLKFDTNMQKEVKEYNAGKKKTIKKQPLNISAPKIKAPVVKKAAKKVAKKATKKHTHWKKVHSHERRVNGVGAVKKSATTMHKDTKSHNVNIRVMSGIGATKISFEKLEKAIKNAAEYKHIINNINKELMSNKNMPPYLKKDLKDTKKTFTSMLKEEKIHITQLKKHI